MKNILIGELLLQYGYINETQLNEALEYQKNNKKQRLGDILISLGFVSESQKLEALATRLNLKKIDVITYNIDIDVVNLIPHFIAVKYCALPLEINDGTLTLAINDPLNYYAIEDIKSIVNMQLTIVLAETEDIISQADYYYSELEAQSIASTVSSQSHAEVSMPIDTVEEIDIMGEQSPAVKTINSLLMKGYTSNASDIHIEPFADVTKVRIRIDGMMIDYINIHPSFHQSIIARVKIISGLDIAEKRLPQDGHFRTKVEDVVLNIRTSVIPTIHGEKAVLRFLTSNIVPDNANTFGMSQKNYDLFSRILANPHGLVYLTGPTGSGKTTTLYMILEHLSKRPINISTIEDPVEKNLKDINQMQVNIQAGLTFESGLRSLLRQDPDILMVGETRDAQTAEISVKSAITGHLVLSTLHTNDALSTIVRLQDMGIEPYMVANSVVGVVAQRLIRKICPYCKEEYTPQSWESLLMKRDDIDHLYRGKGCHICNNTGYKGRNAIHEVAMIDSVVREMITKGAPFDEIVAYVKENQSMISLFENCVDLVIKGETTTEELLNM